MGSTIVLRKIFSEDQEWTYNLTLKNGRESGNWVPFRNLANLSLESDPEWFSGKLVSLSDDFSQGNDNEFYSTAESFVYRWMRQDLKTALEWIDERPVEFRDQSIKNGWREIAAWDKKMALQWIESVEDEGMKKNLTRKYRQRFPEEYEK